MRESRFVEKKRLALLGCGKLNHIVADAYLNGILPEYEVVGVLGRTKKRKHWQKSWAVNGVKILTSLWL